MAERTVQVEIKRQAARFRIYAHLKDGSVKEVTAASAQIEWRVGRCRPQRHVLTEHPPSAGLQLGEADGWFMGYVVAALLLVRYIWLAG